MSDAKVGLWLMVPRQDSLQPHMHKVQDQPSQASL
jgi:hypothetical protein